MHPWKNFVFALILFAIFNAVSCSETSAQDSVSKFCSSEFFSSERDQWEKKDHEFHLLAKGTFIQDGNAYVLAVAFAGESKARTSDEAQFLIFRSPVGLEKFTTVYSERIDSASFGEFSTDADGCVTSGAGIYFHVSVVDLRGNGNHQIIVESNSIGVCSSCASLVKVYEVRDNKITKVVEETYNDIKFGPGQGLWIQSFKIGCHRKACSI